MRSNCVETLRRGVAVIVAGCALGLITVTPAFAGIGGSVVPSFPTPMDVGDIKTSTVTITNHATMPNNTENVNVSGIFFTPSCASSDGFTCLTPDPGVFQFATFIGKAGTACASTVFTAGAPDPGTGEFQLIPPAGSPVVLGPSSVGGLQATCVISMNFQVLRAPNDSTPPNPPLTTDSLARATLQGGTSGRSGSASGGATTEIDAPNLTIDKMPHTPGQMISAGSVASFTITVGNTGTGTASGVRLNDPLPAGGGVTWGVTSQDAGFNCSITGASPQVLNCGPPQSADRADEAGGGERDDDAGGVHDDGQLCDGERHQQRDGAAGRRPHHLLGSASRSVDREDRRHDDVRAGRHDDVHDHGHQQGPERGHQCRGDGHVPGGHHRGDVDLHGLGGIELYRSQRQRQH